MAEALIRLCGLYEVENRAGNRYITGRLNWGTRLVLFKNHNKQGETDPDWHLFIRQDEREKKPPLNGC